MGSRVKTSVLGVGLTRLVAFGHRNLDDDRRRSVGLLRS